MGRSWGGGGGGWGFGAGRISWGGAWSGNVSSPWGRQQQTTEICRQGLSVKVLEYCLREICEKGGCRVL